MRRIVLLGLLVSVICGLWAVPTARAVTAVKLCGSANGIADSLIISGLFDEGGPFLMHTAWRQFVPTLYDLQGGGSIGRTIGDVNSFSGGLVIVNNTEAFENNPTCAVSPVLHIDQITPLVVSGSAELRCIGGPSSPFTVTITFTLIACNDPGPFGTPGESSAIESLLSSPGAASRPTAGYAPNEYRP